jgi:hypothetical protein
MVFGERPFFYKADRARERRERLFMAVIAYSSAC